MLPTDIILTKADSLPTITQQFPSSKVIFNGNSFGVSQLSLLFLNPATRDKEVEKYVLVKS